MIAVLNTMVGVLRRWVSPLRSWRTTWRVISVGQGHRRSMAGREPVDAAGREIPWFTYPATEYLAQLDFRARSVFEFGAGNSTIFWAQRSGRVVAVESDPGWCERVRRKLPANAEIHLLPPSAEYPRFLAAQPGEFDVIVVDGILRRECCVEAVKKLRPGGLVILDNSDWHHRCAAGLREAGLLQVDFPGMGPVNDYAWTTSLFFHRAFAVPPRHGRQPVHGIGSLPVEEDEA